MLVHIAFLPVPSLDLLRQAPALGGHLERHRGRVRHARHGHPLRGHAQRLRGEPAGGGGIRTRRQGQARGGML